METVEIIINGGFSPEMLAKFTTDLNNCVNPCIIVLDIESHGGYVNILESMANLIEAKKDQGFVFVTNVDNYAYSCGFILFLLGDIKVVSDTAELMYHAAGIEVFDRLTSEDALNIYEILSYSDKVVNNIILNNANISPENFALLKKNTTFFDKADLIHLGIMEANYQLN